MIYCYESGSLNDVWRGFAGEGQTKERTVSEALLAAHIAPPQHTQLNTVEGTRMNLFSNSRCLPSPAVRRAKEAQTSRMPQAQRQKPLHSVTRKRPPLALVSKQERTSTPAPRPSTVCCLSP